MVTFAQAQERAEEWVNGDVAAYQHREVRVREFDLGFVVWAEDRAEGPSGGGGRQRLVIARDGGEATLWPGLPVGEVVRRYEEEYGVTGDAPAAPEPPQRIDLNQTSFLLTPPEWLQDAADKLGIPDRRSGSGAGSGDGAGAGAPAAGAVGVRRVGARRPAAVRRLPGREQARAWARVRRQGPTCPVVPVRPVVPAGAMRPQPVRASRRTGPRGPGPTPMRRRVVRTVRFRCPGPCSRRRWPVRTTRVPRRPVWRPRPRRR